MWGSNSCGQLGDGTAENRLTPQKVEGLTNVVDVSVTEMCCGAVTSDGSLYMWGQSQDDFSQGVPAQGCRPMKVEGVSNAVMVSAVGLTVTAVTSDGLFYVVNYVKNGADGIELQHASCPPDIVDVCMGSVLLDANGDLYRYSSNETGGEFTKISTEPDINIIALSNTGCAAVGADGSVYTIQQDSEAQSGDSPVYKLNEAEGVTNAVAVSAVPSTSDSGFSCIALNADGTLYAWGNNDYGQLGIGSTENQTTPVSITL